MKKHRIFRTVVASILCSAFCVAGVGCVKIEGDGGKDNSDMTILKVKDYGGGAGTEWCEKAALRFEKLYENVSLEPGKMGVDVVIDPEKTSIQQDITTDNHIIINEQINIYDIISTGVALEMDDAIRGENPFEPGVTIESKFTEEQKRAYAFYDNKYYAVPHYESIGSLYYNVDLFEEKNLYFAKDGGFTGDRALAHAGPDGDIETLYDNGLPATYEELFELLEKMKRANIYPFTFTSKFDHYSTNLLNAIYVSLAADHLNWYSSLDSGSDKLTIKDGDVTREVSITEETAYLLFADQARYDALDIFSRIVGTKDNASGNLSPDATNGTSSHITTQANFILGNNAWDKGKYTAMIAEGAHWYNEAKSTVTKAEKDKGELRFAVMPMPAYLTGDENGNIPKNTKSSTMYCDANTFMFINASAVSGNDVIIDLAKKFIQFVNTNESLVEYTLTTNITKSLKYDMGDKKSQLSYFGQSLWEFKESAMKNDCVVYSVSDKLLFRNAYDRLTMGIAKKFWENGGVTVPFRRFHESAYSANDYFTGMQINEAKWQQLYGKYFSNK